jgi:peroxiredoxin
MDFPFVALLFFILGIFVLSLLIFFYARILTERIIRKIPVKSSPMIGVLRFCALLGMIACFASAAFALPRTKYGKHLLGQYYFSEYLQTASNSAASKAFHLWQQADDKSAFQNAFSQIPQDAHIWKEYLRRSALLYVDKDNPERAVHYLEDLEKKVTHPNAVSAINLELGAAFFTVDPERASMYFRRVVELKSDPESMDHARGNLHELDNLNIGQEAPIFHLTTTANKIIERSHLLGKVVLLQFWSRNCPSCMQEIPILKKIRGQFPPEDFEMIGISLESDPLVIKFIEDNSLPLPQVAANPETAPGLMESFNIQYIPMNYILGRDGKIAYKKLRGESLEKALQHLLAR